MMGRWVHAGLIVRPRSSAQRGKTCFFLKLWSRNSVDALRARALSATRRQPVAQLYWKISMAANVAAEGRQFAFARW